MIRGGPVVRRPQRVPGRAASADADRARRGQARRRRRHRSTTALAVARDAGRPRLLGEPRAGRALGRADRRGRRAAVERSTAAGGRASRTPGWRAPARWPCSPSRSGCSRTRRGRGAAASEALARPCRRTGRSPLMVGMGPSGDVDRTLDVGRLPARRRHCRSGSRCRRACVAPRRTARGSRIAGCGWSRAGTAATRRSRTTQPAEIDKAFVRCAKKLLEGNGRAVLRHARSAADRDPREPAGRATGGPPHSYEFAFFMGRQEGAQERLLAAGDRVRVYVPTARTGSSGSWEAWRSSRAVDRRRGAVAAAGRRRRPVVLARRRDVHADRRARRRRDGGDAGQRVPALRHAPARASSSPRSARSAPRSSARALRRRRSPTRSRRCAAPTSSSWSSSRRTWPPCSTRSGRRSSRARLVISIAAGIRTADHRGARAGRRQRRPRDAEHAGTVDRGVTGVSGGARCSPTALRARRAAARVGRRRRSRCPSPCRTRSRRSRAAGRPTCSTSPRR